MTLPEIKAQLDQGALFVVNHSGGKDSQAMMIHVQKQVPREHLLVVHATLGRFEWPLALEHAQQQADDANVEFMVAEAGKTFFEMVERRFEKRPESPCWPSSSTRQCTSDLKRNPIQKLVRHYMKAHGFTNAVNCLGLRAQESASRAKKSCFQCNKTLSKAGRIVDDWLPIHKLSTQQVIQTVKDNGQHLHYAYEKGNDRLSCKLCIFANSKDLQNGANEDPELYIEYCQREVDTGYTMHMSRKSLPELTGIQPVKWV